MHPGTVYPAHTCPGCNRFSESSRECPYCGLESPGHPRLRILQLAALTLCITGLPLLLLMGLQTTPPLIPIAGIQPTMNYARVTLSGTESTSLMLSDSAGHEITMVPHHKDARQGAAPGNLPAHQPLQITGHLYLAAGKMPRLYLDATP